MSFPRGSVCCLQFDGLNTVASVFVQNLFVMSLGNRVGIWGLLRNLIITMTSRVFAAIISKIVSSAVDNRTHLSLYFCNVTKPVNAHREYTDRELIIHLQCFCGDLPLVSATDVTSHL